MVTLATVLMVAMLPSVPLPRGAVTNAIPVVKGAPVTWETEGTLPLPYAEARARLLTSLANGKWKLKQTIPMHTQRASAEILLFEIQKNRARPSTSTSSLNLQPTQLFFILQSTGPASVSFNYRREARKGTKGR